jgi:hypothetical protein
MYPWSQLLRRLKQARGLLKPKSLRPACMGNIGRPHLKTTKVRGKKG